MTKQRIVYIPHARLYFQSRTSRYVSDSGLCTSSWVQLNMRSDEYEYKCTSCLYRFHGANLRR